MRIKDLRMLHKMTQDELAEAVGCSRITIARMEAGSAPVSYKIIRGLSVALETPIGEICKMLEEDMEHEDPDID